MNDALLFHRRRVRSNPPRRWMMSVFGCRRIACPARIAPHDYAADIFGERAASINCARVGHRHRIANAIECCDRVCAKSANRFTSFASIFLTAGDRSDSLRRSQRTFTGLRPVSRWQHLIHDACASRIVLERNTRDGFALERPASTSAGFASAWLGKSDSRTPAPEHETTEELR